MFEDPLKEPPRTGFPADFLWGTATAAMAVEGALGDAVRGETIWDAFSAAEDEGFTGPDRGCDHLRRLSEDIELMSGWAPERTASPWPGHASFPRDAGAPTLAASRGTRP